MSRQRSLFRDFESPRDAYRSLRNLLAGQFVGATRDETLLTEVVKCLFCKLYVELGKSKADLSAADNSELSKTVRGIFRAVKSEHPEIFSSEEEILLGPDLLFEVFHSISFDLLDANSDPVGDAFEVFAGSESRARSGQFFTPMNAVDLLVNAVSPSTNWKVIDPACGAGGFLAAVIRKHRRNGARPATITKYAANLVGIDKDSFLADLARVHVSLLSDGLPEIHCGDSLSGASLNGTSIDESLSPSSYDLVLTNPPFGAKIVSAKPETLKNYSLAKKWKSDSNGDWSETGEIRSNVPPQILFLEKCIALLKNGGALGMVIPESVLSNKGHRYAIQFLRQHMHIEAVISTPESLFKTSGKGGTHTKTCLLIAHKKPTRKKLQSDIFMADAKWCGKDSRARTIEKDDFPIVLNAYQKFSSGKDLKTSPLGYTVAADSIRDNVLCPRYYDPIVAQESESLERTHNLVTFGELISEETLSVQTGDEVGKLAYGTGEIPFIRTSDISNWELKLDPKHCVSREIYESLRKKQDVQAGDILMVKDGTYLIGTCGLVTKYDTEILFQSHLYKIRTLENKRGLTPHLLLAILTSKFVHRQIKSKQFTQDIIDSLGERINELVLPIPKTKKKRQRIAEMVEKAVAERIEARELARLASTEVLC